MVTNPYNYFDQKKKTKLNKNHISGNDYGRNKNLKNNIKEKTNKKEKMNI